MQRVPHVIARLRMLKGDPLHKKTLGAGINNARNLPSMQNTVGCKGESGVALGPHIIANRYAWPTAPWSHGDRC